MRDWVDGITHPFLCGYLEHLHCRVYTDFPQFASSSLDTANPWGGG